MIPYFSIEFFRIGPFTFYTWGFFIALAFLVGLVLAVQAGKKISIEANKIIYLIILVYAGAIIGARIFYALQMPHHFLRFPIEIFRIGDGGMMYYGGLFGGLLAGWLYIRKWENRWALISALAPIIPLAMAIGRVACFLNNDHMGALTNLPWGIPWPSGSLRHPVALYLILFDLALAGFLWWYRNKTKWPGQVLFVFLTLYAAGRFLLDFTRQISDDPHYWGLAVSQWISIALAIIALKYLLRPTVDKIILK